MPRWKTKQKRLEEAEKIKKKRLEEAERMRNMKPRRWRMREKHLEEAERRKIEAVESNFVAEKGEGSSPDVASVHLLRSQQLILINDPSLCLRGSQPPPGSFHESVVCFSSLHSIVVGSVNGLICVADTISDNRDDIWILNPVTEKCIKLPLPASPTIDEHDVSFAFYSDPDLDPKETYCKVFKVVCVSEPHEIFCDPQKKLIGLDRPIVSNHLEVWDSRSLHTWTRIENAVFPRLFYHPSGRITSCEFVVEKFAFWIVADPSGSEMFLLSINMETHTVKQISLPELLIPIDFLFVQLFFKRLENTLLFGATWEGSFALLERLSFNSMLYNVWAIDESGASLIKKTTFLVDIHFRRILGCIDGKLLVQQNNGLKVLFDMETRKGEVIGANTCVQSAHDFVKTCASIEGFEPIRSVASYPKFTFWPNLAASASEDASVERVAPASNEVQKTFTPLVSKMTRETSPRTAPVTPKTAPKPSVSVTEVPTKSMTARGVFVKNLPIEVTRQELCALLKKKFGNVQRKSVLLMKDRKHASCDAQVEFESLESARLAVEAHEFIFGGRVVLVVPKI